MPHRRPHPWAALVLAALLAPAVAAQDASADAQTPQEWLQRMRHALAQGLYTGTFVYLRDNQLDALRVIRRAGALGIEEQLTGLSGEPRDLQRGAGGIQLRAERGLARWPAPAAADGVGSHLLPQYELVLAGSDRIADHATRILELRPRDGFRYGYRLWLDAVSGLPLKSITFGADGRAVEQMMFTEVGIEALSAPPAVAAPAAPAPEPATPNATAWQVLGLPDGFALVSAVEGEDTHLLYSDGVARVSVYVEPLHPQRATLSGLLARGALHVFGRVSLGRQITVVGEVPAATAERFAQGVVARDAAGDGEDG